ncbi:hypothetical protein [Arthrobacter sp. NPDC056727]|uniref:hypothetical protein n=1 Tax=Arthrobacter sp. NPDC056727 TaxID=3345927 RepID=UPI00366A705A
MTVMKAVTVGSVHEANLDTCNFVEMGNDLLREGWSVSIVTDQDTKSGRSPPAQCVEELAGCVWATQRISIHPDGIIGACQEVRELLYRSCLLGWPARTLKFNIREQPRLGNETGGSVHSVASNRAKAEKGFLAHRTHLVKVPCAG